MWEYGLAVGIGFAIGLFLTYLLLRKEVEKKEYDLLVIVTPKGEFKVLSNATVQDNKILGTDVLTEDIVSLNWEAQEHPRDFIIEQEVGDKRMGLLFAVSKNTSIAPALKLEEFLDYLRRRELVSRMEALLVQIQSAKMDQYSKFFEVYERLVSAFFSDDIRKHMRAAGALCAKFPDLLQELARGYVAMKMSLGERVQEEEVLDWLENPTDLLMFYARMTAEEVASRFMGGVKKNGK